MLTLLVIGLFKQLYNNFARASCTHTFIQVVLLGEKEKLVNCQSEQHAMHENLDLTIPVSERLVIK